MDSSGFELPGRTRLGWWLFISLLALVVAFIATSYIGILVIGVAGYYGTRPLNDRLSKLLDSDGLAAWVTVLLILLPLAVLLFYAGLQVFQQGQQLLNGAGIPYDGLLESLSEEQRHMVLSGLQNPQQYISNPGELVGIAASLVGAISGSLLFISLAITLTAFLLTNDTELAASFRHLCGGRDTPAYAYATALDEDFESVFFGNFLFVLTMSFIATSAYWVTNALAPGDLHIPMVFVLGVLTGVASLIPLIVGKVVYLPVVGLLALQALRGDGASLGFVAIALVAYFLVLDILPQTFVQPYLSGRHLNSVMLMFGYLLGPGLFGWYGLFFLPMLFIIILEALRLVVPNLVRGEPLTDTISLGDSVGATPQQEAGPEPDSDSDSDSDGSSSVESADGAPEGA